MSIEMVTPPAMLPASAQASAALPMRAASAVSLAISLRIHLMAGADRSVVHGVLRLKLDAVPLHCQLKSSEYRAILWLLQCPDGHEMLRQN